MPVMVEIHSIDEFDVYQEKERVLSAHPLNPGDTREIELAGTRVVYEAVDDTHVRLLHIILGNGILFVYKDQDEVIEVAEANPLVTTQPLYSDAESGRPAMEICDGHLTYAEEPEQPGHTIRVQSYYIAAKKRRTNFCVDITNEARHALCLD